MLLLPVLTTAHARYGGLRGVIEGGGGGGGPVSTKCPLRLIASCSAPKGRSEEPLLTPRSGPNKGRAIRGGRSPPQAPAAALPLMPGPISLLALFATPPLSGKPFFPELDIGASPMIMFAMFREEGQWGGAAHFAPSFNPALVAVSGAAAVALLPLFFALQPPASEGRPAAISAGSAARDSAGKPPRAPRVAGEGGWAIPLSARAPPKKRAPPPAPPPPQKKVLTLSPAEEQRRRSERAAIAAWWAEQHEGKVAPSGWVFPPGSFDVAVAPGEPIQAAIDRCPPGGSVLLLPGTHEGPLVLPADKEVHVFGCGRATLGTAAGTVVTSRSETATLDGLIVRTGAHTFGSGHFGILVTAGKLRVQACDVSSQSRAGICATGPAADPFIAGCRLHHGVRGIKFSGGSQGTVKDCT